MSQDSCYKLVYGFFGYSPILFNLKTVLRITQKTLYPRTARNVAQVQAQKKGEAEKKVITKTLTGMSVKALVRDKAKQEKDAIFHKTFNFKELIRRDTAIKKAVTLEASKAGLEVLAVDSVGKVSYRYVMDPDTFVKHAKLVEVKEEPRKKYKRKEKEKKQ